MTNLEKFATDITRRGATWRDRLFRLRAGDESHWYVNHKRALCRGDLETAAARFIIARARQINIPYTVVAGSGIGGIGLAIVTASVVGNGVEWVMVNDDETDTDDLENGYGVHGADVTGRDVLLVDDMGTSGSSLTTLAYMVRAEGGYVRHAISISDRSGGKVMQALAQFGIAYHPLLEFNETTGRLVPMI